MHTHRKSIHTYIHTGNQHASKHQTRTVNLLASKTTYIHTYTHTHTQEINTLLNIAIQPKKNEESLSQQKQHTYIHTHTYTHTHTQEINMLLNITIQPNKNAESPSQQNNLPPNSLSSLQQNPVAHQNIKTSTSAHVTTPLIIWGTALSHRILKMNTKPDAEASPYVTSILNRTHTGLAMDSVVRDLHGHKPHIQNAVDAQILLACAHYRFTGKALHGFKTLYFPHYCAGAGTGFDPRFLSAWTEDCSYRTVKSEGAVCIGCIHVNMCVCVCMYVCMYVA
jgi:hypothetical protein